MYQKHKLSSGLRVMIVPMAGAKTVTVLILVGVGSRYETSQIMGISHFLEHMFFKGTKSRPSTLQIAHEIDSIGGEFNAFTNKEYTGYYIKSAQKYLNLSLDIWADILQNSLFDKKEIEREKGVILQEMNLYYDTPARYVDEVFESCIFGDHPLGKDIIGTVETIKKMSREDFINFIKEYYTLDNMVLIIAGAVGNKNKALTKVKKLIQKPYKKKLHGSIKYNQKQSKPKIKYMTKKTDQTHFALGLIGLPAEHPQKYPYKILSMILGGGMGSRLFIEIRERRGLAYYVRCSAIGYADTGYLSINAGVENSKIEQAIEVILDELRKISKIKVKDRELKRAKEYLKGRITMSVEDSTDMAGLVGLPQVLNQKIRTPEEIFKEIDKVTASDIAEVACKLIKTQTLNLAMIGPIKSESKFKKMMKI